MREVRWERMFPDELEEAFGRNPTVVFPYGLCEPHGPHDAAGADALSAWDLLPGGKGAWGDRRAGGLLARS